MHSGSAVFRRIGASLCAGLWLLGAIGACSSEARAEDGPGRAFNAWLDAYNANDEKALTDFYRSRLGDDAWMAWALDNRDESGGLDVLEVEIEEPSRLVVRLRERNGGGEQRVTVVAGSGDSPLLEEFDQVALPMPQVDALASMDAFAGRLAVQDKFSGAILVRQGDETLYARALGLADREHGSPMTLDTPFFIASAGKMFTAVAVLQLVEAGRIDLDDPVGRFLPNYPNREVADSVTVRHLLTHRGGMGDIGILLPEEHEQRARVRTIADVIALNGGRGPEFEPGTDEAYSNYGFVLLGAIVEQASGQDYYAYVREHVLDPAGMSATGFPTKDELDGVARGYTAGDDGALHDMHDLLPWKPSPAGGSVSTASDLLRFIETLESGTLLSPAMLRDATAQHTPWYGYGFIVSPPADFPHWGHGGGAPGQNVVVARYPTIDTTMICLSNRDPMPCDRLMLSLHHHLYHAPEQ